MFYPYQCAKEEPCQEKDLTEEKAHPTLRPHEEICIEPHPKGILVWLEVHGINETPEIKCPVCDGKAVRSSHGITVPRGFIRGNCYLNRAEQKRLSDIRVLESGRDPYAHMREKGEVDHLKNVLAGKVKKRQHFGPSSAPKSRPKFKKK